MKRLFLVGLVCVFCSSLYAQVVDTTVCDILKNPVAFNGKIVRITGTVEAGFDQFVVKGPSCGQKVDDIWLAYPEGSRGKAGPDAMLQLQPAANFTGTVASTQPAPVTLQRDKAFKQFDSALSSPAKINGMCLGCRRYAVSATLVGRLDGVATALPRDPSGKITSLSGFGNMNLYSTRLVLQSVSDVTSKEIDYSKAAAASKNDVTPPSVDDTGLPPVNVDPIAANRKAVKAFGADSQAGQQIARALDAFGKEGEKADENGVSILKSGNLAEIGGMNQEKSTRTSPDGILYSVYLTNKLDGNPLVRAVAHMGEHVIDLRSPEKGFEQSGLYPLEFRGWNITVLSTLAWGQKTLTLPGGEILWDAAWPTSQRTTLINHALNDFLSNQNLLSR